MKNLTKLDSSKRLGVLVYLTGSTFNDGGNYWIDPSTLVSYGNVIVVMIQYRMGPFGWLSLLRDNLKGNLGLYDIQLALKWITVKSCN